MAPPATGGTLTMPRIALALQVLGTRVEGPQGPNSRFGKP